MERRTLGHNPNPIIPDAESLETQATKIRRRQKKSETNHGRFVQGIRNAFAT